MSVSVARCQVVGRDEGRYVRAYRNKEVWLIRVKENRLNRTLDLFER